MAKVKTQTTTVEPWSGAKPFVTDIYKKASEITTPPPPAKIYAGPNDDQKQALGGVQALAPKYTSLGVQQQEAGAAQRTGVDAIRGLAGDTIAGKYMDPASNPFISKAVEAAQHDTFRNFWENTNPQLKSAALSNGTYGGDRTDLIISRALEGAVTDAGRRADSIYYDNYGRERAYQQQAPALYAGANALDNQGLDTIGRGIGTEIKGQTTLGQTGDQLQQWDQLGLDADVRKWMLDNEAQWDPLMKFNSILTGGGYNTQTQTTPKTGTSGSIFQGVVGGAGVGSQIGSQIGADPKTAAIIGALLGGSSGY